MSFFKKLSQVATDTASAINNKTNELKAVYEKDSWSGLIDVAEKNLGNMADSTNQYMGNLKRVNENVIHETAKNANSSFEAIWKSTFAVSKETLSFIGKDLKIQALRLYKAWEDIEVAKTFSPELTLLFKASGVLMPEDLMKYCGATRDGAIYTLNGVRVEIYGEIWLASNDSNKQHKGALSLLQYVVVNATEQTMDDDFLLRNCLNIMYKIPEVRQAYDALYQDYLMSNPDITPLESPFDERPTEKVNAQGENDGGEEKGTEIVSKFKDGATAYINSGKEAINNMVNKYKSAQVEKSSDATVEDAVQDFKSLSTDTPEPQNVLQVQQESPEIIRLREELKAAHAKLAAVQSNTSEAPVAVAPSKPATKRTVAKKTVAVTESSEKATTPKVARKTPAKKTVAKGADGVEANKPREKVVRNTTKKKSET